MDDIKEEHDTPDDAEEATSAGATPDTEDGQPDGDDAWDPQELAEANARFTGGWSQRVREERSFLLALTLSLGFHALFYGITMLLGPLIPQARIQFDPSEGVALMARYGLAHGDPELLVAPPERPEVAGGGWEEASEAIEEEPPDEVDEIEDDEVPVEDASTESAAAEDLAEPQPDPPQDDAADGAAEDGDAAEAATTQAPAAPETPVETDDERRAREAAEAAARRQRRAERAARQAEEERRAREAEEARQAELERLRREDPMSLAPGVRYPEGTLNPNGTDIGMWGPEGARVVVTMRSDRIRTSVHRRNLESILNGLPDWRDLVGGANINVFDDVDAVLIASSDPRWVNRTFLAAVHRMPPQEVMARLGSGYPAGVTWEARRNRIIGRQTNPQQCGSRVCDPRQFLLPTENLFLFARPEFIDPLIREAASARGMDEAVRLVDTPEELAAVLTPPEGEELVRRREVRADASPPLRADGWTRGLLEIKDFGGTGRSGPAANLTFTGFSMFRIEGMGRIAPPEALHAVIHADADLRMQGRFVFATRADAEAWVARWPEIVNANRLVLGTFGLFTTLRDAVWAIDFNEAVVDLTIPRATVDRAAATAALMNAAR